MRTLALLALCSALAGISSIGCKKTEPKKEGPGSAIGSGDSAPAPPREFAEGKKEASDKVDRGEKGAERRWDKPASREAKGAEAMVAGRRPKDETPPPKAQLDLPEGGLLTAGSFDDNLFPGPLRAFLKKINPDQSSQDLPSRFLGHRMVITVTNGDGRPVGNARVQVRP